MTLEIMVVDDKYASSICRRLKNNLNEYDIKYHAIMEPEHAVELLRNNRN